MFPYYFAINAGNISRIPLGCNPLLKCLKNWGLYLSHSIHLSYLSHLPYLNYLITCAGITKPVTARPFLIITPFQRGVKSGLIALSRFNGFPSCGCAVLAAVLA
jgi:hypothetical protein